MCFRVTGTGLRALSVITLGEEDDGDAWAPEGRTGVRVCSLAFRSSDAVWSSTVTGINGEGVARVGSLACLLKGTLGL